MKKKLVRTTYYKITTPIFVCPMLKKYDFGFIDNSIILESINDINTNVLGIICTFYSYNYSY